MVRPGRTFRVFVSSTFSDLKAERDALQAHVFPRLRESCAERGARFQAIDLRWGVSQQASRDQQTMNICLGEIERCQEVTPRPNFIVLLGERYGWCPPPSQIPADEFERILAALEPEERALLLWEEDGREPGDDVDMVHWDPDVGAFVGDKGWYRRDDNAVPAQYVLQPWDEVSYEEWAKIEEHLHATLARGAQAAGLDEDVQFKYWASATHQEIAAGAMSPKAEREHVFAFFRRIDGLPEDLQAAGYRDLDEAGRPDGDACRRLDALKDALGDELAGNAKRYETTWTSEGPARDHIDRLCDNVYDALQGVIEKQLAGLEEIDPLEAEVAEHETFGADRARFFTGRAEYLRKIADYIEGTAPHPLAVWGESGTGKSALLARAVQEARGTHPEAEVVCRFIGATPGSSKGHALLEGLCRQIYRTFDFEERKEQELAGVDHRTERGQEQAREIEERYSIPTEFRDLCAAFRRFLTQISDDRKVILFVDALDQLPDGDPARRLTWLPEELLENVRLVVSTLPGDCKAALEARLPQERLVELEPMPQDEAEGLLDLWLEDAHRTLVPEQRQEVLAKYTGCPKPLYLKLAFEEARRWRSYEGLPTGAGEGLGLSGDIPAIISDLFARLSAEANHGELLVSRSLGYLAAARNGLTEDELLDVLVRDVDVYAWFLSNLFHTPPDLLHRAREYLEESRDRAVSEAAVEEWLGRLRKEESGGQLRGFLSSVLARGRGLRLPVVLWSRLYADLEPYLTQQSADGTSLMAFYHPTTFGRAVEETYLGEEVSELRHRALAGYFGQQPLISGEEGQPNLRKLSELPYQQAHGHLWDGVQATLTDFDFLRAKVGAVGPQPLIEDYDEATGAGYREYDLSLVQGALRLSAHVQVLDDGQLAGQLVGRLMTQEAPAIQGLVQQIRGWKGAPWLQPLMPTLTLAGGPLVRTLEGHADFVKAVALTPDGRRAVSGSWDRTLRVWDLESGEELRTLEGHAHHVEAVAVTPDGARAVCGSGRTLKVWDLASGEALRTLKGHTAPVQDVVVTPDGARAVSGSGKTLWVWDLESGEALHTLKGHRKGITAVAVTPDGTRAVSASYDKTLRVWDLESGETRQTLKGHRDQVNAVAVTPDGTRLISASDDHTLKVWDLESGEELHTLKGHRASVEAVAVTPDGGRAISGSGDDTLKVWGLKRGEELHTLKGHSGSVQVVAVTPDGRHAISGSTDRTLKVWNLERGSGPHSLEGHSDEVISVAVTSEGSCAVSGSRDDTIKMWDLERGEELCTLKSHMHTPVMAVAVTPDGRRAVSGSWGELKVWDLERREELHTLEGHLEGVRAVAVTADGTRAVSASYDKTLKVWDLESGEELHTLEGHTHQVRGVAVTPDGTRAISGSLDHTLKVWDLERGKELRTVEGYRGRLTAVVVTPDGTRAISALSDYALKVWDLDSGEDLLVLEGGWFPVAVTPDGRHAISASRDYTLKVWDLERGEELRTLKCHRNWVTTVAVTPDGTRAVSGSMDYTLKVWDLESGEETALLTVEGIINACAIAPDGLTFVAGDNGGQVHFLHLENVASGPPIITARRGRSRRLSVRCSLCGSRFEVEESGLGSILACSDCGAALQVNPFTVDVMGSRPEQGTAPRVLTGHQDTVTAIALTPGGTRAVSGSRDDTIRVWDLESGEELRAWDGRAHVDALAITPDGRRVASIAEGTTDARIRVWDLERGELLRHLTGDHPVRKAAFSQDGRRVLVAREGQVRLWDVDENKYLCVIRGDTRAVSALALARGGWIALLGAEDGTFRIWDLEHRAQTLDVTGPSPVRAAVLTEDATRAICATEDGRIHILDVEHKELLHTLRGHTAPVAALALTRDERRVISVSQDGTIRAWSVETGALLALVSRGCSFSACAVTSDGLTVVAGDTAGNLHIVPLEGVEPVPESASR